MKRFYIVLAFVVAFGAILLGGVRWLAVMSSPVSSEVYESKRFVVRKGQSSGSIGAELYKAGLIRSELAFKFIVARDDFSRQLQAGTFDLNSSMSTVEIAQALTKGSLDVWVTLPEGWRLEEMADEFESVFTSRGADFSREQFLALSAGKEGYLFPDTYLIPLSADEETIVSILENTFASKVTDAMRQEIARSGRTLDQIVTMASLIEREARSPEVRKMVSDILWRRVDSDWALNVDATLQYIHGYDVQEKTWWSTPLSQYKEIQSPYNTYLLPGLPVGPISSVSLSSLEAAIYPTSNPYWFYITDNDGVMRYGITLEEHNSNVQKYLR